MMSREEAKKLPECYVEWNIDCETLMSHHDYDECVDKIYDSMKPQIDSRFYQAIKNGTCTLAVLNDPCMLGVHELDNFSIEVVGCEKREVEFFDASKTLHLDTYEDLNFISVSFEKQKFGFVDKFELYEYYKNYLTGDVEYLISMKKVE